MLLVLGSKHIHAQIVTAICYDEETKEFIKTSEGVDYSTLNIYDKLKFKKKQVLKHHEKYLNENGNAESSIEYVSHDNWTDAWNSLPSKVIFNEEGTKSIFTKNNSNLSGGWIGSVISETNIGEYGEDPRTREKYYFVPMNPKDAVDYDAKNAYVKSQGYLSLFTFNYPSQTQVDDFIRQGFTVDVGKSITQIKNGELTVVWDKDKTKMIIQSLDDGQLVSTTTFYYTFNEHFGTSLLSSEVTEAFVTFSNGDCYEEVSQIVYSNYSDCGSSAEARRSEDLELTTLQIYPNPTSDKMTVKIPNPRIGAVLKVLDATGNVLLMRKISAGNEIYSTDISYLKAGVYFVTITQGLQTYSTKLIKQ